ncbi:TPA: hypothetical protein DEP21_02185 [Patescibacteria group bacterium]|nr:hypothetical protein [Candidatus Gracilibacteria bacterium]
MTKIIAIDLDETLAETLDEVLKFNNYQINGISAQKDDISSYYIHEIKSYNASLEYSIARFRNFFNSKQRDNIKQVD